MEAKDKPQAGKGKAAKPAKKKATAQGKRRKPGKKETPGKAETEVKTPLSVPIQAEADYIDVTGSSAYLSLNTLIL